MKILLYGINFAPELIGIGLLQVSWLPGWLRVGMRCVWSPHRLLTLPGLLALATVAAPTALSSGKVQR